MRLVTDMTRLAPVLVMPFGLLAGVYLGELATRLL